MSPRPILIKIQLKLLQTDIFFLIIETRASIKFHKHQRRSSTYHTDKAENRKPTWVGLVILA